MKQADILRKLALERYELGWSTRNEAFAVRHPAAGHPRVALPFRGGNSALRAELAAAYAHSEGTVPSASALADVLAALEGQARQQPAVDLHLRIARAPDAITIDLGDDTDRVIVVDGDGWDVRPTDSSTPLFRRTELTGPMAVPCSGGNVDTDLRPLLNIGDEHWDLLVAWLVATLIPGRPCPVLTATGQQGSAKSSLLRTLVSIIDPSPADLGSAPRDVEGWTVLADARRVVAIDNLSGIAPWLSDVLCKAVTGDAIAARKLYTNSELHVFRFKTPLLLNGIDLGNIRPDLLNRMLVLELEPIAPADRRDEATMERRLDERRGRILGSLLDLTAGVLEALPDIELDQLPRMADFAKIVAAVDLIRCTSALDTYLELSRNLARDAVDYDRVGTAVMHLMATWDAAWHGTAKDLLTSLNMQEVIDVDHPPKGWPTSARALRGRLDRAAPGLAAHGITIAHQRSAGTRTITLEQHDDPADRRA